MNTRLFARHVITSCTATSSGFERRLKHSMRKLLNQRPCYNSSSIIELFSSSLSERVCKYSTTMNISILNADMNVEKQQYVVDDENMMKIQFNLMEKIENILEIIQGCNLRRENENCLRAIDEFFILSKNDLDVSPMITRELMLDVMNCKVDCLLRMDQSQEALESLDWMLNIDEKNNRALSLRAQIFYQRQMYGNAIGDYSKLIMTEGDKVLLGEFHFNRGVSFYMIGDYRSALEDFSHSINLNASNMDAFHNFKFTIDKLQELTGEHVDIPLGDGKLFMDRFKLYQSIIEQEDNPRIMVVGGVDRGKSTFTNYFVHFALSENQRLCFYSDMDMGQNNMTLPGSVAFTYSSNNFIFSELKEKLSIKCNTIYSKLKELVHNSPNKFIYNFGDTTGTSISDHLRIFKNMFKNYKTINTKINTDGKKTFWMINTPGRVDHTGIINLSAMVEQFKITHILCMDEKLAIPLTNTIRKKSCKIINVEPSHYVTHKSRPKRRRNRIQAVNEYFGPNPIIVNRSFNDVKLYKFDEKTQQFNSIESIKENMIVNLSKSVCSVHSLPDQLREQVHHFVAINDIQIDSNQIQLVLPSHLNEKYFSKMKVMHLLVGNIFLSNNP